MYTQKSTLDQQGRFEGYAKLFGHGINFSHGLLDCEQSSLPFIYKLIREQLWNPVSRERQLELQRQVMGLIEIERRAAVVLMEDEQMEFIEAMKQ